MTLEFTLKAETKTCFRFEHDARGENFTTLYLKKKQVKDAGIDPSKGIVVTIREAE